MKDMVFDPLICPPTPCANRPNLFAANVLHAFLYFWVSQELAIVEELAGVLVHDFERPVYFIFHVCEAFVDCACRSYGF